MTLSHSLTSAASGAERSERCEWVSDFLSPYMRRSGMLSWNERANKYPPRNPARSTRSTSNFAEIDSTITFFTIFGSAERATVTTTVTVSVMWRADLEVVRQWLGHTNWLSSNQGLVRPFILFNICRLYWTERSLFLGVGVETYFSSFPDDCRFLTTFIFQWLLISCDFRFQRLLSCSDSRFLWLSSFNDFRFFSDFDNFHFSMTLELLWLSFSTTLEL